MIEQLTLHGFKGWRKLDQLRLGDITILFGTNSSGKSSILQSLLMLKQTTESYDRKRSLHFGGNPLKDYVDLGSFEDVVYGHEGVGSIAIELNWKAVQTPDFGDGKTTTGQLHYEAVWRLVQSEVALTHLLYSTNGRVFGLAQEQSGGYKPEIRGFLRRQGRPWPLTAEPESCYALPLQARREVQKGDPLEFNRQFELLMQRIAYLGPLREFPKRTYTWTGEKPYTIDPRGSNALDILVAAQIERTRDNGERRPRRRHPLVPPVLASLVEWLDHLGLASQFTLRQEDRLGRSYAMELKPRVASASATITDVGFGVSQVLPVIILLLTTPEHSVVLLEQPELHLHPVVQAGLADLFLTVAHERNLQLIIESHSEHLLRRLQRRMAEFEQPLAHPDHLKLYFCAQGDEGCTAEAVRADLYGNIENWPPGFFGNEVEDLNAMTQAQLQRKRKEAASRD